MSYLHASPANLGDLIDSLKQFAIDYGGFTDTGSDYTSSSYDYTSLTKGGIKFNLSYRDTAGTGAGEVLLNTSTAWAGSGLLTAQTGAAAKNARAYIGLTPIEYWMFTDGDSVHCVVEISSDCYAHISFGVLEKYGSYTGGEYVSANYWGNTAWQSANNSRTFDGYASGATYAGHVRCTYSGRTFAEMGETGDVTKHWARNNWFGGGYYNDSSVNNDDGELWKHQPNNYNGRSMLIPVEMFISDIPNTTTAFNGWIPLGRVSNAAVVNIANLNAGDTVNTDWMVFPLCMKNPAGALTLASGQVDTLDIGFAYKK
jgi:hypothetical protein